MSKLVASDTFQDAWVAANREAHAGVVAALTGETNNAAVVVTNGQVAVNLGPFIEQIKPVLVERGVPFADKIPAVNAQFVVLQSESWPRRRPRSGCSTCCAWCCPCSRSSRSSPGWRWLRPGAAPWSSGRR